MLESFRGRTESPFRVQECFRVPRVRRDWDREVPLEVSGEVTG